MAPAQKTISPRSWAELSLLALIWGGIFLASRLALNEIGVLTLVAHRTGWAALALWILVLALRLNVPRDPRIWGALLVMGLLNNVLPFALLNWAQLYIQSGLTSIFNAATAIFGVLFAGLFFADEQLSARKLIGVLFGFLGVSTAIGWGALTSFDLRSIAQLAAIIATISYALASVWARKTMQGLSPIMSAAGMLTASTLVTLPLAWILEGPLTLSLAPVTWGAIGFASLVATAGAYLLYYRLLASAGSGNLMLVTLLIPPVAILLGALVLGETLRPSALAGFALLGVGLLIIDGRLFRAR
ncbi:DMT family transporter [Shimia abyssi]|uniref:EamA domain-containing membrane protein RarD n=1 Tax=Shimia abyssi TaxID=1662395 RepID=A0A2P8F6P5_9RHOB|nr:DMT family transporter [Shimia abyssi]PSL17368.1 EamA domain-containing membrane protein RarD [Shimia abyssi]